MRKIYPAVFEKNMRLIFVVSAILFFSFGKLNAQVDIVIGTGTAGNGNTEYPCPLQDWFEGSRMQYLYRASELLNAGMGPGNINAIKFTVTALATSTNSNFEIQNYQIKIGTTTSVSLTATTWETVNTTVYGPVNYLAVLGVNTFTFSAPFFWNGTDNIVIEICNGDPNNGTGTFFTGNPAVTWTTGLSFNGSHNYRADNLGNLCASTTTTNTGNQTTRPNIIFAWTPAVACSGTPLGGTAISSVTSLCGTTIPFTLSVTGSTAATGLTFQWESSADNTNWSDISGATNPVLNLPGLSTNTYYRRRTSCGANSATSTSVLVTVNGPAYATIPYIESFESSWINACDTRDVPNNFWRNTPATGNNSWRRVDDPTAGAWVNPNSGLYNPPASVGAASARFHSFQASSGSQGQFDLFINCNTPDATKALSFDFINTSGNDSLVVFLSTNGGTSFTRLDSVRTAAAWRNKIIFFTTTSPTTVIRFRGVADFGATDIGLDNVQVLNFPNCSGIPVGGTLNASLTSVCNASTPINFTVTGATFAAALTYQWQSSTDNITFNNVAANGTNAAYTSPGVNTNTYFRRRITCQGNDSYSDTLLVSFTAPSYAPIPYTESFESTWLSVCDFRDVPNNYWRNNPATTNNSWRRDDDGLSANWTTPATGAYTPAGATGAHSARFHSQGAANTPRAQFDLHINASTGSPTKRVTFNYINTNGNDSLVVYLSTNGGTTFTRLDSVRIRTEWTSKSIDFTSSSATTIIRFEAIDASSTTDIGLDDVTVVEWAPCAGAPNGGTATSSVSTVCVEPFSLSATGITTGLGVTYQWLKSTDNISWTPITGATNLGYVTTQIGTTYYALMVTCAGSGLSDTSAPVQVISPQPVSGIFDINNALPTNILGGTFHTFAEAYEYIRCGINGPVVFNVRTGIGQYTEQLIMNPIPGASTVNTVTFKGNGAAAIGFASDNSNERAVIKLRGTRYIIFDSLVINANNGTYGYGVQLMPNTDSNIVRNCIINSSLSATNENFAGIVINGTDAGPVATGTVLADVNEIANNTIRGGYYGITLAATFTGGACGDNKFIGNRIEDFYRYGIYVAGSYRTRIEKNRISRPTRADVTEFTGIYFTTQKNTECIVTKNRISNPFGAALSNTANFYGIHFNNSDGSAGAVNTVSNNLVYNVNGAGAQYGIANTSSDYAWYFHNTVSLDDVTSASTATTRGFNQVTAASNLFFINNIISITRGGTGAKHCIYLGAGLLTGSDNNDFYINAAAGTNSVGFLTSDRSLLADWRLATGMDASSVSSIPAFIDPVNGNFTPGNAAINDLGTDVGVIDDINDVTRTSPPDIGAYEFTPPPCSVPPVNGTVLITPLTLCQNNPVFLSMNIGPFGSAQTFQWQTATTLAGPFTAIGAPMLTPDTTINSSVTQYYRVAISCGASTVYSDTVLLNVNPALPSGTYTIDKINPTTYVPGVPGGNFNSFAAAKTAMGCGITGGPIVFNVVANSGPYTEQLILDSIPGTSAVNTITFNGNGNTLTFAATTTTERAVLKFNGADHIIFDSLRIENTSTQFGYGVQLIRNADSNTLRKCTIITSASATTTDFAGIVMNAADGAAITTGATLTDGNLFDRNTITGGYYGVTLVGSTTAATFIQRNSFIGNTIQEFYNYGMYVVGTNGTVIEGNTITRPTRTTAATNLYGVYLTSAPSNRLNLTRNRFSNFFGGAPANTGGVHGVYHNAVDAASGSEDTVSNNLFYNMTGNGLIYPLYNTGSNNVLYYHNTIVIDNPASTATANAAAFYQTTTATGLQFKNNIVVISRGGTGNKYGIFKNTAGTALVSDNNDFYLTAPTSHVGYQTSNRTTLAAWVAATTQDSNSYTLNPLFTDPANGDFKPQLAAIDNKGEAVGITYDILLATRSLTTPDLGAYEFAPVPCQDPPTAGTATITPATGLCLETPIRLNVSGHSPLGNITFQWQSSLDGTNWNFISPVQFFPEYDTVAGLTTWYRAAVTCNSTTTYTTPVQLTFNNLMLAGTYTINAGQPVTYVPGVAGGNFQTFQSAVNAMLCGITGSIVFNVAKGTYNEQISIPYIPGTSATTRVTFQGLNLLTDSAVLAFGSTVAGSNYTLKLDSTRNFTFRNIRFRSVNPALGRVIEVANGASSDSILNCEIIAPAVTSDVNTAVGVFANAFRGSNIVLKGNKLTGGANAVYFAGTSAALLARAGHVIDSNSVSGAYGHGIYVQFANKISLTRNRVDMSGALAANATGIRTNTVDSTSLIRGNSININDVTSTPAYGIYVQNTRALLTDSLSFVSNKVIANTGNTGSVYGIVFTTSKGIYVRNNVIVINSAAAEAYGLQHLNNTDINMYYNNSVHIGATGGSYAGHFSQATATARPEVKNNIFSNKGAGRALYVNNPGYFSADYNMLYTTGASLVQVNTGSVLDFPTLKAWNSTWNWDRYSISFDPAFTSNTNLEPNIALPNSWAMHGRGVQIKGNTTDFNNNYRPDSLTAGVPDLGAYEFYPTALPAALVATPATPAANTQQTFTFGTDTVMRITWGATAPASVDVQRFSGVVPAGLLPGTDSMFFYTKVNIPGGANFNYSTKLYYLDPWQGSIPQQSRLGLGRTTPSNAWVVGANSRVDVGKREISQEALAYLDRFTGLVNPFAQPEDEDSSSNRGKDFWVGYQRTNGFGGNPAVSGSQVMVLYFGAGDVPANVTVTIEGTAGTPWVRNYFVPANSALTSDQIPKLGPDDARLFNEGLYAKKGIHITSDVPVVAYAHIYEGANSGATMLMPTAVWGYEYYTLSSRQNYSASGLPAASAFHIVAQTDSTWVEINPSKPTLGGWVPNGGTRPNGSYLVKLNKGDSYQVLGAIISGNEGNDLTGSYVKSIANNQGQCHPIAVFSGSTRTGIGCGTSAGSSGDLIIQQIFPYQAWGNKYATAPTSIGTGPSATSNMTNIYRVMVKDPATVVKRNNVTLTGLVNNRYYQFESNTADYIEATQPILVAQYMSSSGNCPNTAGDGDPEMFYLSPLQQAIKETQFYRNDQDAIDENFITLVIPTEGLTTLKIDGINYQAYPPAERYVYDHPNLPGYSVITKRWAAGSGSSTVESDQPFTGVVYGLGSVESYGYNVGTLVKNLNNLSSVNTVFNTGANPTEYTCRKAPFRMTVLLPLIPESITWRFSQVPRLSPSTDSLQNNPVPVRTVTVNGIEYYEFVIRQDFVLDTAGIISIPISYTSPFIEKCDFTEQGSVVVQVLPSPVTNFAPAGDLTACAGATLTFTGDLITQNGIALNQWNWTFHNGSTATGQVQTFTYPTEGTFPVKLSGVTADGCISDTTRQVVISASPVVTISPDSLAACPGNNVTFTISNPIAGATYNWYNVPTGGAALGTGTSFTATNVNPPAYYYAEAVTSANCVSAVRKRLVVSLLPPLAPVVITTDTIGVNLITFRWNSVAGAGGSVTYQVSLDGGSTWITPSSGANGLTHTVAGLRPGQEITIIVRATDACQVSTSLPFTARTLLDEIFIPNAFTPNGDGLNDDWRIYANVIKEIRVTVFNQWGEKIYESRVQAPGWDGTFKGKPQPSGVYMYVCSMTLLDNSKIVRKGAINLIR